MKSTYSGRIPTLYDVLPSIYLRTQYKANNTPLHSCILQSRLVSTLLSRDLSLYTNNSNIVPISSKLQLLYSIHGAPNHISGSTLLWGAISYLNSTYLLGSHLTTAVFST